MVFCLEQDPENFFKLDVSSLKEELAKPGKWVRALPANKHPISSVPSNSTLVDTL